MLEDGVAVWGKSDEGMRICWSLVSSSNANPHPRDQNNVGIGKVFN